MKMSSFCLAILFVTATLASAQTDYSMPSDAGMVDITTKGASGSDNNDDTEAFETSIKENTDKWKQIYLPAGAYIVTSTVGDFLDDGGPNKWRRFYTIRGAGPGKTIIKVPDNTAYFGNADSLKPVILCWNRKELAQTPMPYEGGVEGAGDQSNDCHSIHIMNLTIDIGAGNPGAVGLDFTSHNGGGIENVEIKAAGGSGAIGLALNRKWPGPALIKNVSVDGFKYGIHLKYYNYTMTLEHITLKNQSIAGIFNENHIAAIRKVTSTNSVPAIINVGLQGYLIIFDSKFTGGASDNYAIESSQPMWARNIEIGGYTYAVGDSTGPIESTKGAIGEYNSEKWRSAFDSSPRRSLGLPVKETPTVSWDSNFDNWANVDSYKDKVLTGSTVSTPWGSRTLKDWTPAVQAAIDSDDSTVYFPNIGRDGYPCKTPIHIKGKIKRILGLSASVQAAMTCNDHQDECAKTAKLIFDDPNPNAVVLIEQLRFDSLEHKSPGTLILVRCHGSNITTHPSSGDLFMEDQVGNNMIFNGSNVWARDLNNESRVHKITNNGAKLWILGYKTEMPTTVLFNKAGAQTEILGGLIYPVFEVSDTVEAMYVNENSALSLLHGYNHYWAPDQKKYSLFIKEVRDGQTTKPDSASLNFDHYDRLKRIVYVSNPDSLGGETNVSRIAPVAGSQKAGIISMALNHAGQLVISSSGKDKLTVQFFLPNGRMHSLLSKQGPGTWIIDRKHLPRGVYIVNAKAGRMQAVKKLTKMQ